MNLATAPNVVFHYFLYFSSPFANFSKGLEIRLSLSPATLFLGVSLPNHTKCLSSYIWLLLWMTLSAGGKRLGEGREGNRVRGVQGGEEVRGV